MATYCWCNCGKYASNVPKWEYISLYLRSQLAEDAAAADLTDALRIGVAHVPLRALVLRGAIGSDVALHQRDSGDDGVAHRVPLAHGAGGQGAVREGGLQGVQQVHHDLNELWMRKGERFVQWSGVCVCVCVQVLIGGRGNMG